MGLRSRRSIALYVCLAAGIAVAAASTDSDQVKAPATSQVQARTASLSGAILTEDSAASALARLHPDYTRYIRTLRVISAQGARVSPEPLYSGLVRKGGREPRLASDAPATGRGARNDVVLFPALLDPARSPGWRELILDHEYFHARHLARGWKVPLPDFGNEAMNRDFYEALAWSYVVERARQGVYASLSAFDLREVTATYRRHHDAFRREIMKRQPSAWAHYGRFLVDPDPGASVAAGGPPAGQ